MHVSGNKVTSLDTSFASWGHFYNFLRVASCPKDFPQQQTKVDDDSYNEESYGDFSNVLKFVNVFPIQDNRTDLFFKLYKPS